MKEHLLPEENGHVVSFTEHGNLDGPTILSFHGGPGARSRRDHAHRFDLTTYRVVLFDQRGCGKSTPLGGLEHNTTQNTLHDAERIREALSVESWFVSGSSWGSTLALLYAIAHPTRVRGILVSAVYLGDKDSIEWSMVDPKAAARMLPDVWERRMAFFKKFGIGVETQNADILKAFENASLEEQKEITAGVQNWEGNLFSVHAPIGARNPEDVTDAEIASAKIFCHYEMHEEFIADNFILENAATIATIPLVMVHGRYDILCPLDKVYELHKALPYSELVIATSSGHKLTAEGETIRKMAYEHFLEKRTMSN